MAASSDDLVKLVTTWLERVSVEGATLRQSAAQTIVPAALEPHAAGLRALAALRRLADEAGADSARIALEHTLGEGGMGVVRLASQVTVGRKVAVKTLKPGQRSEPAVLHLLREGWITGALEHPNVVPVYDIGLDAEGAPLIILKRIDGVQWSALMFESDTVRERFGADDLLAWNLGILMQVANAIRFAHSRGIIHRDLKPDNVMIGEFGEVYVLDWGIAVSLRDDGSGRLPLASEANEMAGTPCYMAPEMLGGADLSERTDIYLLGAILHEILAGEPPHTGETPMELVASIAAAEPRLPKDAPAALAAICRRAMDPDPDGRFERVEQLRLAVQGYLQHRSSERLADRADRLRVELEAALTAGGDDGDGDGQRYYEIFGQSRFGYREALAQWPGNARARAGLRAITLAMADRELAGGQPRAAQNLLAELGDDDSPEIRRRMDEARAAEAVAGARIARLEALGREHDLRVGTRTRFVLAIILGLLWTAVPLVKKLGFPETLPSNGEMVLFTVGLMALLALLGTWARETLSKTAINRALAACVAAMALGQLLLFLGAWLLGLDPSVAHVLMFLPWIITAALASVVVDRRLAPMVIVYIGAFLVAARWPEATLWAMAASNFALMINAAVIWRPAQLFRRRGDPQGR